jgi:P27 family predicted phage terminase small subunit
MRTTATAIKKAKGTLNKSKKTFIEDEPQPNIYEFAPKPPDELGDRESMIWNEIVPKLVSIGIFSDIDTKLLVLYCTEVALYEKACEELRRKGYVGLYGANNYPMKNPWIDVRNRCNNNIINISKEIGLTPASRTRISVGASKPVGKRAAIIDKLKKKA